MKTILALACCASALPAWANDVDVGVGIGAKSNDSTIYVPIDFGEVWRLEPFVNYERSKDKTADVTFKTETLSIGTGIFGLKSLAESFRIYYGGRLAYLDLEADQFATASTVYSDKGDGFRIAPTLGFEYSFNEHVSLGGEAAWFYQDVDMDSGGDRSQSGTDTRLILRFRF